MENGGPPRKVQCPSSYDYCDDSKWRETDTEMYKVLIRSVDRVEPTSFSFRRLIRYGLSLEIVEMIFPSGGQDA